MLVIADSGSTKADWKLVHADGTHDMVSTIGFNPFFYTPAAIEAELRKSFVHEVPVDRAEEVHFYGAGCSTPELCAVVEAALRNIFPRALVKVEHDLLAAARATCGHDPGVACILGTGSNSCQYDGEKITDNVENLAFLLGDEGSGTHLGKKLLRAYFYREMPVDLREAFEQAYPGGKSMVLEKVYGTEHANVFLASFAKFLSIHSDHFFVKKLVFDSFAEFVDRHVRKYAHHVQYPVHFIGSVAFHFQPILNTVLAERDLKMGIVVKKPIENLVKFHLQNRPSRASLNRH
ncbi:MAG: hypothetical protein AAFW73_13840 [Bacteroidota bacterium]